MTAQNLTRTFQRPDPHYAGRRLEDLPKKWSWAKRWRDIRSLENSARRTDRRTQEQRERDVLGPFYDFIVAAKAEDRHVTRVRKAQAAQQHSRLAGGWPA